MLSHKLPQGVEYLQSKILRLLDMPDELIGRLSADTASKDYQKVAHVADIYSGYWRNEGWVTTL